MVMVKLREVSKTSSSLGDGEDDPAKRKWKTYDEKRDYKGNVDKFSLGLEDDKKRRVLSSRHGSIGPTDLSLHRCL